MLPTAVSFSVLIPRLFVPSILVIVDRSVSAIARSSDVYWFGRMISVPLEDGEADALKWISIRMSFLHTLLRNQLITVFNELVLQSRSGVTPWRFNSAKMKSRK